MLSTSINSLEVAQVIFFSVKSYKSCRNQFEENKWIKLGAINIVVYSSSSSSPLSSEPAAATLNGMEYS
jgi:hypothetical protein